MIRSTCYACFAYLMILATVFYGNNFVYWVEVFGLSLVAGTTLGNVMGNYALAQKTRYEAQRIDY